MFMETTINFHFGILVQCIFALQTLYVFAVRTLFINDIESKNMTQDAPTLMYT